MAGVEIRFVSLLDAIEYKAVWNPGKVRNRCTVGDFCVGLSEE